jgi:anti-anti-sigma regulatory factor
MSEAGKIVCEESLDLSTVAALHAHLLLALAGEAGVEVVASAVERVDTANLQILCAAARDLRAAGRAFRLTSPSAPFLLAARRLGVAAVLDLQPVPSPVAPAGPSRP